MVAQLRSLGAPYFRLGAFAVAYGIAAGVTGSGELEKRADLVASIGLPLLVAFWVLNDAQARGRKVWYDFDSFIFFAWPLVLPLYLFQTRGIRALWTILCFALLWIFAACVAAVVILLKSQ